MPKRDYTRSRSASIHLRSRGRKAGCGRGSPRLRPAEASLKPGLSLSILRLLQCVGALQMAVWAKAKHARLRKVFDGKDGREKYPRRWILMPPFF